MAPLHHSLADTGHAAARWLAGWWRIVHLGALLLALALSPSSYAAEGRRSLMRHIYLSTAPALPSSVASPHPMTPWLVSSLTKTQGRSGWRLSETPNTFRL